MSRILWAHHVFKYKSPEQNFHTSRNNNLSFQTLFGYRWQLSRFLVQSISWDDYVWLKDQGELPPGYHLTYLRYGQYPSHKKVSGNSHASEGQWSTRVLPVLTQEWWIRKASHHHGQELPTLRHGKWYRVDHLHTKNIGPERTYIIFWERGFYTGSMSRLQRGSLLEHRNSLIYQTTPVLFWVMLGVRVIVRKHRVQNIPHSILHLFLIFTVLVIG